MLSNQTFKNKCIMGYLAEIQAFQPLRIHAMNILIDAIKLEKSLTIINQINYGHDTVFEVVVLFNCKRYSIHASPFSNEYMYVLTSPDGSKSNWTKMRQFNPNGYELMLDHIQEQG
jgi:hypothetical protein